MIKLDTYPKWLAVLIATLLLFSVLLSACKTTEKTVAKKEINRDSVATAEALKRLADMEKQRDHFESRLKEMEYLQANFQECPPVVNMDSLREVLTASGCDSNDIESLRRELNRSQARYQRLADGSVIIEGNLASVTAAKSKQEDSLREITKENIRLMDSISRVNVRLTEATKETHKEVTRKPVATWYALFFVIGMIVGGLIWDKWGAKIKTIGKRK